MNDDLVIVNSLKVSRRHATLSINNKGGKLTVSVKDSGSSNGTFINYSSSALEKDEPMGIVDNTIVRLGRQHIKLLLKFNKPR